MVVVIGSWAVVDVGDSSLWFGFELVVVVVLGNVVGCVENDSSTIMGGSRSPMDFSFDKEATVTVSL